MAHATASDADIDALVAMEHDVGDFEEPPCPWRGMLAADLQLEWQPIAAPAAELHGAFSPVSGSTRSRCSSTPSATTDGSAPSPWSASMASSPSGDVVGPVLGLAGDAPMLAALPAAEAAAEGAAAAPAAVPVAEAPAPRKRLRAKTPAPPGFPATSAGNAAQPQASGSAEGASTTANALPRLVHVPNYSQMVEALRKHHCKRETRNLIAAGASDKRQVRMAGRREYALLSLPSRVMLCEEVLAAATESESILHSVRMYQKNLLTREAMFRKEKADPNPKDFKCRGPSLLLTYFGHPVFMAAGGKCPDAAVITTDEAACRVRHSEAGKAAVAAGRAFAEKLAKANHVTRFAWTLEVCPRTWADQRSILLHLHVALVRVTTPFNCVASALQFDNMRPSVSKATCLCRDKRNASTAALLYCSIHKIGTVDLGYNAEPFHDYHVNPEWITNILQAGKVTVAVARELYLRGAKNVVHHLQNLERVEAEQRNLTLRARASHITAVRAAQITKFKEVPLVTQYWLPQFQHIKPRYAFLVLQGPSGTGKTSFAKHITGSASEVLEVNCSACPEPDLRNFDPEQHRGILFDEASPSMVLSQRRLFQAPPCWIDLGCSTTNCHKYQVWVSGMMLMVTSNSWTQQVRELKHAGDRQWLDANSLVVNVHEPLWVQQ